MGNRGAVSYDADAQQRRAIVRVVLWFVVFVVASFAFAYSWRLYAGPYKGFYAERALEQEKAAVYIKTDVCNNLSTRARLEGYNDCERSRRVLAQSVTALAFYDLMDDLKICHRGICKVWAVNLTDSIWTLGRIVMVAACLLWVMSFAGLISTRYGYQSAMYQLPMTVGGGGAAAANSYVVQIPTCHFQQQQQQQQQKNVDEYCTPFASVQGSVARAIGRGNDGNVVVRTE